MARERSAAGTAYDWRFDRMWEFYLACSEASFRHGGLMVFQAQLSKAIDAVPLTRDYIGDAEHVMVCGAVKAAEVAGPIGHAVRPLALSAAMRPSRLVNHNLCQNAG